MFKAMKMIIIDYFKERNEVVDHLMMSGSDWWSNNQFTLGNSNVYKLCSCSVAFKNKSVHLANNWRMNGDGKERYYGIPKK